MDVITGKVLVDNLADLWQQHNSNSGLREPVYHTNPALLVAKKPMHQHLFERIKHFNQGRYQKWTNEELYRLVELIWLENRGYQQAVTRLGRSKSACKQMMYHMRKAGVLIREEENK
ncbi:hypothetical protein V6C27_02080 [Peptococcaceae bacterium 1198_IL3148]